MTAPKTVTKSPRRRQRTAAVANATKPAPVPKADLLKPASFNEALEWIADVRAKAGELLADMSILSAEMRLARATTATELVDFCDRLAVIALDVRLVEEMFTKEKPS